MCINDIQLVRYRCHWQRRDDTSVTISVREFWTVFLLGRIRSGIVILSMLQNDVFITCCDVETTTLIFFINSELTLGIDKANTHANSCCYGELTWVINKAIYMASVVGMLRPLSFFFYYVTFYTGQYPVNWTIFFYKHSSSK